MNTNQQDKRFAKIGMPPGALVHIGKVYAEDVRISMFDYTEESIEYIENVDIETCGQHAQKDSVTWIHVTGLHDVQTIEKFGSLFNLSPLVLEDILNTEQQPKVEEFADYVFVATKMIAYNKEEDAHELEHFCLIFGQKFLITFHEVGTDVLDPLRKRLEKSNSRLRSRPPDYLAYAILDTLVDNYLYSIERARERIEDLEEDLLLSERVENVPELLHRSRRELIELRRAIWPMETVISHLFHSDTPLIRDTTDPFLRDTHDHVKSYLEMLDRSRELISGLQDIHFANISNRMNEIMKVLTVMASIFIPLTFIAGIYGMNFHHMPELSWPWAYPVLWGIFILVGGGLFLYFKRKDWL
jgi:magnesium transporter